jgi:hypothetical protein
MKARPVLLLMISFCLSMAAAAQDTTCEDFQVGEPTCVAPCSGSPTITNMIVGDNGAGVNHIEYQTFTCSSSGKSSCTQTTQIPTAVSIRGARAAAAVVDAAMSEETIYASSAAAAAHPLSLTQTGAVST